MTMEDTQQNSIDPCPNIAHKFAAKARTQDVFLDESTSFADLGLSPQIHSGLYQAGFEKPSPIQLSAIPYGRCGLDLVVQAKSGTGKTCVFTVVALEAIDLGVRSPQVLILAPTREIALQIEQVVSSIGVKMPGLICNSSIGGLSLKEDMDRVRRAHVVIGTPGRIKQLMELSALDCKSIRLFVLDEADKLMEESFQEQINWIYSGLAESKQVIAASATYTEELVQHLCNYMYNPTFIRLNSNDPVLIGVRQYKKLVPHSNLPVENYNNKVKALIDILSRTNYQQCLVFSNLMSRAENLSKLMLSRGWPTAHISGNQEQTERMEAITKLKTYNCRILISTDLTARGIDADRIDLVVNLDLPFDHETYLHRVGRAGRYGAKGAAVTIYTDEETSRLDEIAQTINTEITVLPDDLREDFIQNPIITDGQTRKAVQVESFQIINSGKGLTQSTSSNNEVSRSSETKASNGNNESSSLSSASKDKANSQSTSSKIKSHKQKQVLDMVPAESQHIADVSTNIPQQVSAGTSDISHQTHLEASDAQHADKTSGVPVKIDDDSNTEKPKLEIIKHRPPFQSLGEALKFLSDPDKHRDMLSTTEYMSRLGLVDEKPEFSHDKDGCLGSATSLPEAEYDPAANKQRDQYQPKRENKLTKEICRDKSKDESSKLKVKPESTSEAYYKPPETASAETQTDTLEASEQQLHTSVQGYDQYQDWNSYYWYYNEDGDVEYYTEQDMQNWYYYDYNTYTNHQCSRCQPAADATAQAFHTHYKNAYLQHVYIASMSRRYDT